MLHIMILRDSVLLGERLPAGCQGDIKGAAVGHALCLWSPGSLWLWIPSGVVVERRLGSRGFFFFKL